ncbi:glycosyl transferase [Paraferrimonas haliotis]|uniref:Glycosyl transferase n=1 Tax=Paraferrimonas haliotis TaxID=2013866 RepID=A0AA37WW82_9GAMM|nr:glycosyl transferase [Paraferrimonas haliotis]GLS83087.1 glycosyl transferase [Paraferrimonas haliotis]
MADFYQNGIITTLHNINRRPLSELEADLCRFSKQRPLGLVLPSLYSELETKALPNIVKHLQKVPYLSQVIIGLDRANLDEYQKALAFFSQLPQQPKVLWNDGPRLKALDRELKQRGLAPEQLGKGRNVWYCFGYALATQKVQALALHDCDILTYDRELLARLIYPVAHPSFQYKFCKGYYARAANGSLNGRVSRLLVTPLIRALKKIVPDSEYLEYLDSYRYPLAGEFSFRLDVLSDLRIPSDWGLEIGVLAEMKRNYASNRLCQVDICDVYDHKHQDLSIDDEQTGLSRMSIDISKALFRKLATQGTVFNDGVLRSLKATYYRMALDFIESYRNDALINGLNLDIHKEEAAVELFAQNIIKAGNHFLNHSMETPFIPSWDRVVAAMPDVFERLVAAVEQDMQDYSCPIKRAV